MVQTISSESRSVKSRRIYAMIQKRRMLTISAAVATISLGLAACGGLEDDSGAGEESGSEGSGPTIVNVPKLVGEAWFDRMEEGVDKYAEDTGTNYYMQGSGDADANAQVRVMNDLLTSGVDALTVVPFQPDAVEQV